MLDINVKTIDGQNRSYSVPDNYSVKQFKEKIANSLSIPVERQRLIFQGRELKDTNSLSEFDVNGKTLHLVQRIPPTANQPQPQAQFQPQTGSNTTGGVNTPDVSQLIQHLIGGLGELGQNATFNTTTNGDSNGMEVHIDLSNVSQLVNENEIRSRIRNIRRFLTLAQSRLNRLEEIQSGAPLDDTSNSSIIVGSIHGTASLSDGNGSIGTIGFDINHFPMNNLPNLFQQIPGATATNTRQQTPSTTPANDSNLAANIHAAASQAAATHAANIHAATAQAASIAAATQGANIHAAALRAAGVQNPDEINAHAAAVHAAAVQAANAHAASVAAMLGTEQATSTSTTTTTTTTENNNGTTNTTTTSTPTTTAPGPVPSTPRTNPSQEPHQNIGVEVLGDVIQSVMDAYGRFLPYLQHYHSMLINDESEAPESPSSSSGQTANLNVIQNNNTNIVVLGGGDNRRQRFCNNINDMMHLLGHLFHNLSDLHINIRDRPPRQMHTMNSMQHSASAIISAAVPIEANVQLPFSSTTTRNHPTSASLQEQLAQLRQRQRSSQSLSGDSTTSNVSATIPTPTPTPASTTAPENDTTEATDLPIPLPFSLDSINQPNNSAQPATTRDQPSNVSGRAAFYRGGGLPGLRPAGSQQTPFQLPPLQYSQLNSYDQYLPCNSVHFYNTVNPLLQQTMSSPPSSHTQSSSVPRWRVGGPTRGRGRGLARFSWQDEDLLSASSLAAASQRRRHPAGDQQNSNRTTPTPTTNQSAQTPPTSTSQQSEPNVQTQFPGGAGSLNQLLGNILASTLNGTNPAGGENQHIRVNIGGIPGQISISTLSADLTNTSSTSQSNPANIIENLLQGLSGGGGPAGLANLIAGVSSANPSSNANPTQPANSSQMVNALMREAISLMDSNNTNDERLNQPLREFLRMFGEDEEDESSAAGAAQNELASRSTLSIFNTLFSSMTLGDMINLARGQDTSRVFERSRQPLRTHIRNYFNQNTNDQFVVSDENISSLADRLYSDIFIDVNGLHIDLSQFDLSDNRIDFAKSFEKLIKHHLRVMLKHVFDAKYDTENQDPNEPTWSAVLFKNFHNLVNQLVTLSRICLKNADSQFTVVVTQKLRQAVISQNISNNSMFYGIFENFVRTQVQQTLANINLPRSSIEEFILYKEQTQTATATATASSSSNNLSQLNNTDNQDAKSTDSSKSYETASSTLSGNFMDIDNESKENSKKTNVKSKETKDSSSKNGKEGEWKNIVPSDWVPIIEKDLVTQKNQQSTIRPFSDAYCSGMPAKRRRILSSKNEFLSVNSFKKVLGRTLEKVQLKPNVSHEQLIEDSIDHSQLIDSFNTEFDAVITDRLRNDPDFNAIIKKESKEQNDQQERFSYSKKRFS